MLVECRAPPGGEQVSNDYMCQCDASKENQEQAVREVRSRDLMQAAIPFDAVLLTPNPSGKPSSSIWATLSHDLIDCSTKVLPKVC